MNRTLSVLALLGLIASPVLAQNLPNSTPANSAAVPVEAPANLQAALATEGIGDIVALDGLNPLAVPALPVRREAGGGRMVYSGSPEYAPGPGILYQDTFSAGTSVRLYVYHVNNSTELLRFSVVLEPVDGPASVAVENSIVTGPGIDYFGIGRLSSFIQLGRPTPPKPRMIEVNGPTLLDEDLDGRVVPFGKPQPLVHSIHDFTVRRGAVRVSVVAVAADAPTLRQFPHLTLLPRDKNHDRGTYADTFLDFYADAYSTEQGVLHLRLADGKTDPFLEGEDVATGRPGRYRGNYGVIYRIHLRMSSPDGRRVALALNPRAGGLAGAVASIYPRFGKAAHYAPSLGIGPVKENTDAVVLGRYDPAERPDVTVLWTPPGSASLPVEMLLIPYR